MSIELQPGEYEPNSRDAQYFEWLESHIRDKQELLQSQEAYRTANPVIYRIIAEAAAELSHNDPRGHATYFGSLLLIASEMHLETARIV